jgi:hypothetical protein
MESNGMKELFLKVTLLTWLLCSGELLANEFEDRAVYVHASDVILVVTASVDEAEIIQELGGFAVVARSQENISNPNIQRVTNLSIMRDDLGRLGLADHSVLFSAHPQFDADSIAIAYGMQVVARYATAGWARLQTASLEDARTLITQFETDDRVRLVELNVNFYDIEPH